MRFPHFAPVICALCLSLLCPVLLQAASLVGTVSAVSGQADLLPAENDIVRPVQAGLQIFAGDTIRTGQASRVAVLCVDESQIKLGENTVMVFKSAAPSERLGHASVGLDERGSAYRVEQGRIWLRNSMETFRFEMTTPAVTAAIRGTEFVAEVGADGTSTIALLQGALDVFNDFGALQLASGEGATASPGSPPRKYILVQPEDAVQWVLYYPQPDIPGTISLAGLDPAPGPDPAPGLHPALAAYDRGNWAEARAQAGAEASASPQARTVLGFLALREGDTVAAWNHFTAVLSTGADLRAQAGRSLTLLSRGDPGQAWLQYEAAVAGREQTPDMLNLRGLLALMAGQPDQARTMLRQGLALQPDHAGCHALLARIDLAGNRKDAARSHAENALRTAPDSPQSLLAAALCDIAVFDLVQAETRLR